MPYKQIQSLQYDPLLIPRPYPLISPTYPPSSPPFFTNFQNRS